MIDSIRAALSILRRSKLVPALVALATAPAWGQGNITFRGDVPAVLPLAENTPAMAPSASAARSSGSTGASDSVPGFNRANMGPVTPEESEKAIRSRTVPANLNQSTSGSNGQTSRTATVAAAALTDSLPASPESIAELARALKNDPDLIYEHVRNNIAYYPTWGIQKGARGALIDKQGTAFDQAELMVKLLQQAGYSASFVKGTLNLTAAQIQSWLGVSTSNVCAVLNLFGNAQIPVSGVVASAAGSCPGSTASLVSMKVDHVWVKASIGGTSYYFDPSFKGHTAKTGVSVGTAMGYNASSYLTSARTGATITSDYVQGISRANIRSNLNAYASSLATYVRANLPAARLDDVVGGLTIVPHSGAALRQTALPYQDTSVALTEWTAIPATYLPTLRVQYQGIDRTYSSDAIYGKRLSITFNASNQPMLMLDGVAQATGTAVTPGTAGTITLSTVHGAYANTFANRSYAQSIVAGGTYIVGNGWGPGTRGAAERFRSQLEAARASGAADGSESVLGSSLAVLSATWIGEVNRSDYITDRLAGTNTLFHHQIGVAGFRTSPYVDLPGNLVSVVSQTADAAKERAAFYSNAMHSSIFESVAVQQAANVSAVSTVKLIDIAAANNDRIYNATAANYSSVVAPNLVSCAPWSATFQQQVSAGNRLILPARCNITENSWSGAGYFTINSAGTGIGAIIGGGLAGGFGTTPTTSTAVSSSTLLATRSTNDLTGTFGSYFGDPIDMVKGNFVYSHEDIKVGVGEFPLSLSVQRLYNSGARLQSAGVGKGWTTNLLTSVAAGSDGFQGMGEDSALDAVAAIVEKFVSLDLMTDSTKPLDKMVIATLGQRWVGDWLTNNTVVVKAGINAEVFAKLPDGSFNAPPGVSARLTQNADSTYRYETVDRNVLAFDTSGRLSTYSHPSGVQVRFTYSGNDLTQVQNSLGRTLTLTYASGALSTVTDGARTVSYGYDASGNLTSFTDSLSKVTTYQYDLPGRMTKLFYPSNPSVAYATNTYDSLGRVATQTNAASKLYQYYFAGSRSEEVGPGGVRRISYFDGSGSEIKTIDPLGRVVKNDYDGHNRLVRKTLPQGNATTYRYDDATCASTEKRCTHNVREVRNIAKSGSGLADSVSTFAYETAFNKLANSTDPRGKVWTYTYTAQGNPATTTGPADAAGVQPVTTFGYTSYSVSGYPAFYLKTSQTSRITASDTVVVTTAFNTANKFVPQTETVDSGSGRLNITTSFTYDSVGNLVQENGPRTDVSDITSTAYDSERRPVQITDALGKVTLLAYDADGRLLRTASQAGTQWLVSCSSYAATGKVVKAWGPALTSAASTCPTAAAPVSVVDYAYDDLSRVSRVTESLTAAEGGNRVTDTAYYADGTVQQISRGVGTALASAYARYTYNGNGLPATVTDAKNNRTTFEYDGFDRRSKISYPNPTTPNVSSTTDYEQFSYDAAGNLLTHRRRSAFTVSYVYDNLNRLVGRNYSGGGTNVTFGYDLLGRRTSAQYADGTQPITYVWDRASRMTSTLSASKLLSFQYDLAGNRTRVTWPESTFFVTTTYDALNRPVAIKELDTTVLATYAWDDVSRRTSVTFGNGTSTSYAYNTQGVLSTLSHNLAGTTHDVNYGFARNQAQELTSHSWSNDLYQWKGYANGTKNYAVNGLNQYTSVAGVALSYTTGGNLAGDGSTTYSYDADNRLRTATRSGFSATLTYDPEGRMSSLTQNGVVTHLRYDGPNQIAEYDSTGTVLRRAVFGPGTDEPIVTYEGTGTTNKSWLYADHTGSVVALAGTSGVATAIQSYGPFGETSATGAGRFRFTGQQYFSGLGLYYFKARFYAPTLGRFLQTDPVGIEDDLNMYSYAGNNPINASDPSGGVLNFLAGGGANVAMGWGLAMLTGQEYGVKQALVDFGIGAATSGVGAVARAAQISAALNRGRQAGTVIGVAQKTGTPLHSTMSEYVAAKALDGGADAVYLNRAWGTAAGAKAVPKTGLAKRPDVIAVEGNTVRGIEIGSKTDKVGDLAARLETGAQSVTALNKGLTGAAGDVIGAYGVRLGGRTYGVVPLPATYGLSTALKLDAAYQGLLATGAAQAADEGK